MIFTQLTWGLNIKPAGSSYLPAEEEVLQAGGVCTKHVREGGAFETRRQRGHLGLPDTKQIKPGNREKHKEKTGMKNSMVRHSQSIALPGTRTVWERLESRRRSFSPLSVREGKHHKVNSNIYRKRKQQQKKKDPSVTNYLGLELHYSVFFREAVKLLVDVHHSDWNVSLFTSRLVYFLLDKQQGGKTNLYM